MDYESWDRIADAVNPTVGVITLALALAVRRAGNPPHWAQLLLTLACVTLVYALGWVDAQLKLWPAVGLDYSSHTGVHVAIVASLWMIDRRFGIAGVVIALLYAALMVYQKYHTILDIASTALAVVPLAVGIWILGRRAARTEPARSS
jgi:hypothetical protein